MTKVKAIDNEALSVVIIDRLEVSAEHKEILLRSVKNSSHLWLGTHDEIILCFFGLIPPTLLSDTAYLWLYTTTAISGHTIPLIRASLRVRSVWLSLYSSIVGHGTANCPRSLAWLRLLGAEFGEPTGSVIPFEIKAV